MFTKRNTKLVFLVVKSSAPAQNIRIINCPNIMTFKQQDHYSLSVLGSTLNRSFILTLCYL